MKTTLSASLIAAAVLAATPAGAAGLTVAVVAPKDGPLAILGQQVRDHALYLPALVLIFMAMFGLPRIGVFLPPFLTVVACLGLVAAAYVGEVLRGALGSIDAAQREAALALGMSPRRVFWSVLLPQAWRLAVPGLMVVLSLVLPARAARALNVGLAAFYAIFVAITMPGAWWFYLAYSGIEILLCAAIIWLAWRWPRTR